MLRIKAACQRAAFFFTRCGLLLRDSIDHLSHTLMLREPRQNLFFLWDVKRSKLLSSVYPTGVFIG
jgi:hypothetical protein